MRGSTSRIRIIGGRWRGRSLEFRAEPGLRPTPDRVRETLFNWLQPHIADSRCLDLFCGSGALGFEALSRGAAQLTSIDRSAAVIEQARHNLARLGGGGAEFVIADALSWLQQHAAEAPRFDVAFIDPPFHGGQAALCLTALSASSLLASRAWIYLESAASEPPPPTPPSWILHRDKRAGQVAYRLYLRAE